MKYNFEKAEKSTVKITITLEKQEWADCITEAYNKMKGRFNIPGFRKGKVPKKVIENAYGTAIFYEEAINIALPKYYGEVLDKEPSIEAVAHPEIDIKDVNDDILVIEAITPVKPEVTLGEYKGIKFEKAEYPVKAEDIDAELSRLQERNSRMVEVTDRAVANGDSVVIDYSGSVAGVKFAGGTAEKQNLVIGSGRFIPGFEEQIIGMNIGDEKDINVTFPAEYHAEELKGKDAVFAIKLHEIKVKEIPELNDEFIKDAVGCESVEAYKKETEERLAKQNADRAERELEDAIVKKISDDATVEIPNALIEMQIDRMVQEMEYRLSYQGLRLDDYLKYLGKSMDDYRADYKEQAESIVKSQLVIEKIIETEKFEATDAEVDAKLEEMAKAQGKEVPDIKKNYGARQLDYIKNEIIIKKLFEALKGYNTIAVKGAKKPAAKKTTAKASAEKSAEDKPAEKPAAKTTTAKKTSTTKKAPAKNVEKDAE
ncbi:MAG: trigger factor [Clostridia bacterium]|nr:trigger factor [Clostridia bacterium]